MKADICITGKLHAMREWDAIPRIGEDVFVKNIDCARRGEKSRNGYLKVCAVLWEEDSVTINLSRDGMELTTCVEKPVKP